MRGHRQRRATGLSPLALAGWLFAELAMVLVVVAFGSYPNLPADAATPPSPPPTATGEPEGLSLHTVTFTVSVSSDAEILAQFRAGLQRERIGPGQVGLVLLFGVSRDGQPLNGVQVSQQMREVLLAESLPELSQSREVRPYIGERSDGRPGDVKAELFVFSGRR